MTSDDSEPRMSGNSLPSMDKYRRTNVGARVVFADSKK